MKYKVKASCNLSLRVKKKQPSPRAQAVCRPPPPPLAVPVKKKQLSPRGHVVRRLQSATMRPSMYAIGGSGRAYERWREEQRNTRVQLYTCGFHEMGCPKRWVGMAVLLRCGVRADSEMDCTVFKTRAQESVGKCTGEHVAILKEMCQHTEQLDACFRLLQDTIFVIPKTQSTAARMDPLVSSYHAPTGSIGQGPWPGSWTIFYVGLVGLRSMGRFTSARQIAAGLIVRMGVVGRAVRIARKSWLSLSGHTTGTILQRPDIKMEPADLGVMIVSLHV